jgi:hypothetical protein
LDLQAEMDRTAENTKQPEVLRELFEALANDPVVVAECLARSACWMPTGTLLKSFASMTEKRSCRRTNRNRPGMDSAKYQHERAVGDRVIEWCHSLDRTNFIFHQRCGELKVLASLLAALFMGTPLSSFRS